MVSPFSFAMSKKIYILYESYPYEGCSQPMFATDRPEVVDAWDEHGENYDTWREHEELELNNFKSADLRTKFGKFLKEAGLL